MDLHDSAAARTRLAEGRGWWHGLSPWTRLSLVGLVAAAGLAVGLGVYIPRQVARHMLGSQAAANREILASLVDTKALNLRDGSLAESEGLDRFARESILRGGIVRVKLWSPDGTILYSDDERLVGARFRPSSELRRAFTGDEVTEISDLSDPENLLERTLSSRLLEFYLPVEQGGEVVAVWEVYQALDRFEAELGRVRRAVWVSVGSGLALMLVFFLSTFGNLLAAIQRRRREAEELSRELGTLLGVARSVRTILDPDELAAAAVRAIRESEDFRAVALIRRPDGGSPEILASSTVPDCPLACIRGARAGRWRSERGCVALGTELGHGPGLLLVACRQADRPITEAEEALLIAAGEQVRIGLENANLYRSLQASEASQRRLMRRLMTAQEEERRRVVGDIHDGLGQDLHRVLFGLRGCRASPPAEVSEELARLEELVEQSSRRLRGLLQTLRPTTLEDVGLAASLRQLADRVRREDGLEVSMRYEIESEPPVRARVAAFRIVQEALRNASRHSGVDTVDVDLSSENGLMVARVSDRGRGFVGEIGDGLGMWLMQELAESVGGSVLVDGGPPGVTVTARIPLGGAR